jgi:hypothetical protein
VRESGPGIYEIDDNGSLDYCYAEFLPDELWMDDSYSKEEIRQLEEQNTHPWD